MQVLSGIFFFCAHQYGFLDHHEVSILKCMAKLIVREQKGELAQILTIFLWEKSPIAHRCGCLLELQFCLITWTVGCMLNWIAVKIQ